MKPETVELLLKGAIKPDALMPWDQSSWMRAQPDTRQAFIESMKNMVNDLPPQRVQDRWIGFSAGMKFAGKRLMEIMKP